ncbi:hypothetical protein IB238_18295 [Rhizobium sp. ARZ01]|uniref:hypothetical protein n=1 Tax=Rhizobium sp. ARZ01 TaxID=2769313 RepID=UPI00177F3B7A|nr:hypothetical protein [Rhizobium sp. ARZ01]MBD9374577.1 hypothetical protein [Rhizobium sp. ARZ01]
MFYMGGMTLGYFSPHPAETGECEPEASVDASAEAKHHKSLLELLKPVVPQARRRYHTAWPIHVFY